MRKAFHRTSSTEPYFPIPYHAVDTDQQPSFALGLMGGGSWGAFTAGVLHVLVPVLETIGRIKTISGTSAGALNAVLLAGGINDSGANEGVRRVNDLWRRIQNGGALTADAHYFYDWMLPPKDRWPNLPQSAFSVMALAQVFNPLASTGTTHMISALVDKLTPDWKSVQSGRVSVHINTIREHIRTKHQEHIILTGKDITPHGVGASAALSELGFHQILDKADPIERLKELQYHYFDGGYIENPPLEPLRTADVTDLIVIKTHDHNQKDAPPQRGAKLYHEEIHTDVAGLALDDANRLNIHAIEIEMADGEIHGWNLNDTSKLNTSPQFITALHEAGQKAAHKWLAKNFGSLGNESSYRPHSSAVAKLVASGFNY